MRRLGIAALVIIGIPCAIAIVAVTLIHFVREFWDDINMRENQ